MRTWTLRIYGWLPAALIMLVIFLFSAQPSSSLPDFQWLDTTVKKGGHVLGYAFLALAYWRGFHFQADKRWLAWLLTIFYAITDEFHQSFVPGRHASVWDVLLFDNLGALVALWLASHYEKQKRPDPVTTVAEQAGR